MQAGRLRCRVELQQLNPTVRDTYGDATPFESEDSNWSTIATRWAEIVQIKGRQGFDADRLHSEATHRVRLRYLPEAEVVQRLLFGRRKLLIQSFDHVEQRQRETVLVCREVQSRGLPS